MRNWRPQLYKKIGQQRGYQPRVLDSAIQVAEYLHLYSKECPPVFSLKHLAQLSGTKYPFLRAAVARLDPKLYRHFKIRKRPLPGESQRYRIISVPDSRLAQVQRWIDRNILVHIQPDEASVAFSSGDSIKAAASFHCCARWIIKIDIRSFFESITEQQVYGVFLDIGYQPLVAFEMSRICTRLRTTNSPLNKLNDRSYRWGRIGSYRNFIQGYLPQGAPTSPRLSNLVSVSLDRTLRDIACSRDLIYTRYADDLTFSTTSKSFSRRDASNLIACVYSVLRNHGYSPNYLKTKISSPGSRKLVLGLLVDHDEPKLTREFKQQLRQHLYFLANPQFGPRRHAEEKGFASIYGLQNHIKGLLIFASHIEPEFGNKQLEKYNLIDWP